MIAGSPWLDRLSDWVWGTEPAGLSPEQRLAFAELGGTRMYLVVAFTTLLLFTPLTLALRPDLALLNGAVRGTVMVFLALMLWVTRPDDAQVEGAITATVGTLLVSMVPLTEVAFDGGANHPFSMAPAFFYLGLGMFVPLPAVRFLVLGWVLAILPWPFWLTDTIVADGRFRAMVTAMMLALAVGGALSCRQRRQTLWDLFHAEQGFADKASALEAAMLDLGEAQAQVAVLQRKATVGRVTGRIAQGIEEPLAEVRARVDGARDLLESSEVQGFEELREALEDAAFAVQRTSRYVEGLAGGARQLESTSIAPFDVANEIEVVVGSLGYRLVDAEIEVRVGGGRGLTVTGEAAKFSAVMRNLLENAVESVEAAGSHAPIDVRLQLNEHGVEITIVDHGIGVPAEVAAELFQPMVTTRRGRGAGMGLSNAHDVIVGDFGGTIRYTPTPGGGATFVLVLPPEPLTVPPVARRSLPPMPMSLPPEPLD
ncbi:MAG: hypothetical protein EP330_13065 [Deltaproteobacteria bacterium]|nr:MAG: hypothetical protein EP330_13065 [Deltaproteobacteria bacterium]